MSVYLLSPPGPTWHIRGGANFRSQAREATRPRAAYQEWLALADALVDQGAEVLVLPPPEVDPPLTGLMYAANHGAVFGETFVVSRMHVPHRRAEAEHVVRFVTESMGLGASEMDVVWEGQADIATLGRDTFVLTYGVRTAHDACERVRPRLPPGARVREVKLRDPWFHGDTCLSALTAADGHTVLLVFPGALVDTTPEELAALGDHVEVLEIDEADALAYACNALQVGRTLLVPAGVSDGLLEQVEARGIEPQVLAFDELFGKGGGGPRCLVNVLRGYSADQAAEGARYSRTREEHQARVDAYPE